LTSLFGRHRAIKILSLPVRRAPYSDSRSSRRRNLFMRELNELRYEPIEKRIRGTLGGGRWSIARARRWCGNPSVSCAVPATALRIERPVPSALDRSTESVPSTTQKPCWTPVHFRRARLLGVQSTSTPRASRSRGIEPAARPRRLRPIDRPGTPDRPPRRRGPLRPRDRRTAQRLPPHDRHAPLPRLPETRDNRFWRVTAAGSVRCSSLYLCIGTPRPWMSI
jgi:hypothetical protein